MFQLYKRGKVYWARINGERRSTKCRDAKAAEAVAREWERRDADPSYAAAATATVDSGLKVLFAELKRRGRSKATLRIANEKGGHIVRVFGHDSPLTVIEAKSVDRYIATREGEEASPLTITRELSVLRQMLRVARRRGEYHLDVSQVMPVGYSPRYVPRTRWLTLEELQKLLARLGPSRAAHVAFIVATGARRSEAASACREDVDLVREQVLVRGTKTKTGYRQVPVTALTRALLEWSLANAPGDAPLFQPWGKLSRDLHLACARVGIAPCTPNDLRRTHATWLSNAGVAPHHIARVLGHATSDMVELVYGRIDAESLGERLRERITTVPNLYLPTTKQSGLEETVESENESKTLENQASRARVELATYALGKRSHTSPEAEKTGKSTQDGAQSVRLVYGPPDSLLNEGRLYVAAKGLLDDTLRVETNALEVTP